MDFFYPEKINYWENKHGGNAENSHFKGFYEGAGSDPAQEPRHTPRPIRNFPAEKQSHTDKQADDKCRINKK